MPPETLKLLRDIHRCTIQIADYLSGKDRDEFLSNAQLREAVQWNFAIIGEALSQLSKIDAVTASKVSEWRRIIAFRNQLIHGYAVIDSAITWDIVHNKLPILRREVEALLLA